VVSLSVVSRSAFSCRNPGANSLGPSSPPVMPQPIIRSPVSLVSLSFARHPSPEAATRHPKRSLVLINRASGPLACIAVSLVNVSTCQHVPSRKRLSPCQLAHVPPRGSAALTFALLHRSTAPICTFALSLSGPQVLGSSSFSPSQLSGSPLLPPLSAASSPCPHVTLPTCPLANFHSRENWRCPSILFSTSACCSGVSPSGNFFEDRRQRSSHSCPTNG